MRVIISLKSHYEWDEIPADVEVTQNDIKAGLVIPSRGATGDIHKKSPLDPKDWRARVVRKRDTHNVLAISEETLVQRIVHDYKAPPQGNGVMLTRKEAIGTLLAENVLHTMAHPRHITGFEVECDDGPDEALFRSIVTPLTTAISARTKEPIVHPEDFDALLAKYLETHTVEAHVDHLHAKFGVKKKAA